MTKVCVNSKDAADMICIETNGHYCLDLKQAQLAAVLIGQSIGLLIKKLINRASVVSWLIRSSTKRSGQSRDQPIAHQFIYELAHRLIRQKLLVY